MSLQIKEEVFSSLRVGKILGGVIATDRVANAYLFLGPDRKNTQSAAQNFAQALNCQATDQIPCQTCLNCRLIAEDKFVDVIKIFPEGTSIKIEQVREIKDLVKFGPNRGKHLVVIIHSSDKMTTEAANSLLKILEEPQGGVVFVLVADTPYAILSTIKSRCHKIIFPDGEFGIDEDQERFKNIFNFLSKEDLVSLFNLSKELSRNRSQVEHVLEQLMLFLRQNLQGNKFKLKRLLKIVMQTLKAIKRKAAARLALDVMFLKLVEEF